MIIAFSGFIPVWRVILKVVKTEGLLTFMLRLGSWRILKIIAFLLVIEGVCLSAQPVNVATSSNFVPALRKIVKSYNSKYPSQKVLVTQGSTGKLVNQILQGAPFDVFFAADKTSAELLKSKGLAEGEPKTYAFGQLALVARDGSLKGPLKSILSDQSVTKVSIASPKHAPYGIAAVEFFQHLKVYDGLKSKLVYGESVGQALQFLDSGTVSVAVVAYSLVARQVKKGVSRNVRTIPTMYHKPIEQQVVLIKKTKNSEGSRRLFDYVFSPESQKIINDYGYSTKK